MTRATAETVLQFGAGRFLRAFVDRFLQNAHDAGQNVGRAVVVQSTPGPRAALLQSRPAGFGVLVRGYADGQLVERRESVQAVSRALLAEDEWPAVLDVASTPELRYIVTNATEAGYVLHPDDRLDSTPPRTLPAKLAQVLWRRFQRGAEPLILLPCELIEGNARQLRELVATQARAWGLPTEFEQWLREKCPWLCNLVDCIVTRPPDDHPLMREDPLLVCAEPYALWAIERPSDPAVELFTHPAVRLVDDLKPFYLRKVRILNGLHSALVGKYFPAGFVTVQQVLEDPTALRWVRNLLYEEIVPTLVSQVEGVAQFADETLDRLRNPFLQHRLADIALNHADKLRVRLQPTFNEYQRLFGRAPPHLASALAPLRT
jgi:tagaturonate reductase